MQKTASQNTKIPPSTFEFENQDFPVSKSDDLHPTDAIVSDSLQTHH